MIIITLSNDDGSVEENLEDLKSDNFNLSFLASSQDILDVVSIWDEEPIGNSKVGKNFKFSMFNSDLRIAKNQEVRVVSN